MKKVIVGILAAIGVLAILAVFAVVALTLISVSGTSPVPRRVILELDLEDGVIETIPDDPMAQIMLSGALQLRDVVDALERGADDRRVVAVFAKISGEPMAMAQIQEVRDAIKKFRKSGKPAIAFAETFGEFGPGNGGYYLATAFDEVHMQPSGDVGLTGLYYETMFLRGAFDKIGLEPRMGQRYEYKNAVNSYTHTSYTEPHREALERVMESRFSQIVRGIAEARGITEDDVRNLAERGPLLGQEALEAGLVDALSYRDQVMALLRERTHERARLLYVDEYIERAGRPHARGTQVALIHGYGGVARGPSRYSPIDGTIVMGSDTVTAAFRAAIDNDRIKAILFRVDSPGGSYVASDTIWRETMRAREAGKPVVVSMGNVAGSGGYFVAMAADRIVAQPGTITASIGVYGGKMLTTEFWEKLGITHEGVSRAYPMSVLNGMGPHGAINDNVNGLELLVVFDATSSPMIPYNRRLIDLAAGADAPGRLLTFDVIEEGSFPFNIQDRETGTVWSLTGIALTGELEGARLQPIATYSAFWFAWAAFNRDTEIYSPSTAASP